MRRWLVVAGALILAAAAADFGLRSIHLSSLGHALAAVRVPWLAAGFALMAASLVARGISWMAVLRAALPGDRVPAASVLRATMIGVMASAALPGRVGEAARAVVVARRLGNLRGRLAVVAGTILAQTLLNLLALGILAAVVLTSITALNVGAGVAAIVAVPLLLAGVIAGGPALLRRASRHGPARLRRAAAGLSAGLEQARAGLRVFRNRRYAAVATVFQLGAWALQVCSCFTVLRALGLHAHPAFAAAAAVLLAVNVTAVVPIAPSNVGVFQAACIAILAAFGVGASSALAYGVVLQALEVVTAAALGLPALAGEGLTWAQVRRLS